MEHDVKGVEALSGCVLSRAVALGAAAPRTVTVKKVKQEALLAVSDHPKEYNLRTPKPRVVQTAQEPSQEGRKRKRKTRACSPPAKK